MAFSALILAHLAFDPSQVFTIAFLVKLALIALTAAGIHDALRRAPSGG